MKKNDLTIKKCLANYVLAGTHEKNDKICLADHVFIETHEK